MCSKTGKNVKNKKKSTILKKVKKMLSSTFLSDQTFEHLIVWLVLPLIFSCVQLLLDEPCNCCLGWGQDEAQALCIIIKHYVT